MTGLSSENALGDRVMWMKLAAASKTPMTMRDREREQSVEVLSKLPASSIIELGLSHGWIVTPSLHSLGAKGPQFPYGGHSERHHECHASGQERPDFTGFGRNG